MQQAYAKGLMTVSSLQRPRIAARNRPPEEYGAAKSSSARMAAPIRLEQDRPGELIDPVSVSLPWRARADERRDAPNHRDHRRQGTGGSLAVPESWVRSYSRERCPKPSASRTCSLGVTCGSSGSRHSLRHGSRHTAPGVPHECR